MPIDTHTHLAFPDFAIGRNAVLARAEVAGTRRIEQVVRSVIGRREATTGDLGGNGTTMSFTNAVIDALHEPAKESLLPRLAASESPW